MAAWRGPATVGLLAACIVFLGAAQPGWQHVRDGQWQAGGTYFTQAIVQECTAGAGRIERLTDLYAGRLACEYFARAENALGPAQAKAVRAWLLSRAEFTRTFLLALRPEDDVGRVFEILHALLSHSAEAVERFPQMTIAFCVTWDGYMRDPELLVDSFRYYVENAEQMTYHPASLPYGLRVYVVDTRRDLAERRWALQHFAGTEDIARHYDNVWRYNYDIAAQRLGREAKLAGRDKTLENIQKYGGVSRDAALYASEIGKAIGVPSAVVATGGRAWLAFLRIGRSKARWDLEAGRLGEKEVVVGKVRNPQTGARVPEHELRFDLAALRAGRTERRAAEVWRGVAELLADSGAPDAARRAVYNSLNGGVYDRRQWRTLAKLAQQAVVPPQEVISGVEKLTGLLSDYPNLAADALARMAAALPPEAHQRRLRLYDRMIEQLEGESEEAQGRLMLLKGQYLEQLGRESEALDLYVEASQDMARQQAVVLDLLANATRILLEQGRADEAIELHEQIMHRVGRPRRTRSLLATTWARVGLRAAKLYALTGDRNEHDDRIDDVVGRLPMSQEDQDEMAQRLAGQDYHQLIRSR